MVKMLTADVTALVHTRSHDGWTPLGLAVRSGAIDITKALLEARANVHAVSDNGKSALEIAAINKKPELVKLLQGARCHAPHGYRSGL